MIEEDKHWWFAGRTWSLLKMAGRLIPPRGRLRVLDIGCGAGNMIHHLTRWGPVVGIDNNPTPLLVARERGYDVREGSADALPFDAESFELLSLLDTLEHCPDDGAVLRECHRVCSPGGHLIVTVPAFMWLWSHNDALNAHQRRYTTADLTSKLQQSGFRVCRTTYNNFFLFPPAALLIWLRRGARQAPALHSPHLDDGSYQVEMEPAPPLLNALLRAVTWIESEILRRIDLPVGTSIICIAQKPNEATRG